MLIRFILHGFPHYIRLMADQGMWGKRERECKGEREMGQENERMRQGRCNGCREEQWLERRQVIDEERCGCDNELV